MNADSTLRRVIESAKDVHGLPLKDLTVLAAQRDPYRLDTPANHAIAKWCADAHRETVEPGRVLHIRALHYAMVGRVKLPDGSEYTNTDENWEFLANKAVKAARYLGYLDWDLIRDARNSPPQVFDTGELAPWWGLETASVELLLPDDLDPRFRLYGNVVHQPVRQAVIAEKQGVQDLLLPVCRAFGATLALPAGEISDTMVYQLLKSAAADGRPLAVHQLGDCDPAGHQMACSTARTIQAIRDSRFPDLQVIVHAPALTVEQCVAWDLPSTPLKETERRADRWLAAMGRAQTELDAAVALAPDELARVVRDSLKQYWDTTAARRDREIREQLEEDANQRITDAFGAEELASIRQAVEGKLTELEELVEEVNKALRLDPGEVGIGSPEKPPVEYGETRVNQEPLIDTAGDWVEATRRLVNRKAYTQQD
jgi:hypothetical protein